MNLKFALIGAAGYVAPRHMKAILDTDNDLIAVLDPNDSVGILDRFFIKCKYFKDYERFDRYLEKIKRTDNAVDYVSICSPNYLHDAHCRLAMRIGANVICEKPLVLNPWNIDQLAEVEKEYNKKINVVLQLRYHPELLKIKKSLNDKFYNVNINYITPRGPWYHTSWKGQIDKSGGLATNIGIHLFDLVLWLFGKFEHCIITKKELDVVSGTLILERAKVDFYLSTTGETANRSITINDEPIRFDNVFNDLHTVVYQDILNGGGLGIEDARPSIELVHKIRNM